MTLGTIKAGGCSMSTTTDRAGAAGILSLLSTNPEHSTLCLEVNSLQHCVDSGGRFRLGQDASSIFAETLCKLPWLLLVECFEA